MKKPYNYLLAVLCEYIFFLLENKHNSESKYHDPQICYRYICFCNMCHLHLRNLNRVII